MAIRIEVGLPEVILDDGNDSKAILFYDVCLKRIGERFFALDGREHQATFVELNARDWTIKIWDLRVQANYGHDRE